MTQSPSVLAAAAGLLRVPFLRKVIEGRHTAQLAEVANCLWGSESQPGNLNSLLREIHTILTNNYRCEYIFKNAVAKELFLRRHRRGNAYFGSEMRIGQSRADAAIFNGTSTVYEIKSEYDSFDKLEGQIRDYQKVFDNIYLVIPTSLHAKALRILPSNIGIIHFGESLRSKTTRQCISNRERTAPSAVFDVMRREEQEACLSEVYGPLPAVPNGDRYTKRKALFETIEPSIAHDLMVKQMRKRARRTEVEYLKQYPHLAYSLLTADLPPRHIENLLLALS